MNKNAQFFLLTAIIISSILVGLASVRNSVTVADAPQKFYYYSEQLDRETGAVVDHGLYTGNVYVGEFVQQGISSTLGNYPDMDIYACYSDKNDPTKLTCQNNGTQSITVWAGTQKIILNRTVRAGDTLVTTELVSDSSCFEGICYLDVDGSVVEDGVCNADGESCVVETTITEGCAGTCRSNLTIPGGQANIIITMQNGNNYTLPIRNTGIQTNQFYFLFRVNTTSGEFVDVSGD